MNFSTTADDFTILKNGIDSRLEIIQHVETGFYNITKIAKLVNSLKAAENKAPGIPGVSVKQVNHWFTNDTTQVLIQECLKHTTLDYVQYELKSNTPTRFAGTYVHELLYDPFLAWLDAKYSIKISIILKAIHDDANRKIIKDKDDKVDKLQATVEQQTKKMDQQSFQLEQQSAEIRELLGYAKETVFTLHEVHDDLAETKEEVKIAKTYLEEKSITSTLNPSNESKHHYFGATTYFIDSDQHVKFVSGQKSYVDQIINKRVNDRNHKVIIKPFYNANGIDLRQNVYDEFVKRRNERIKEINKANSATDAKFNAQLKVDIAKYNTKNPTTKRFFMNEKRKTPLVRVKDISVKFGKLSFIYTSNPHIVFNEVLQIIIDVNDITQESPLQSDEE